MKNEIILRPYQEQAVEKALWATNKFDDNSLVVISQGGGKTLVISSIADSLGEECIILSPSREILQQTYDKMLYYVPEEELGIFSASFNKKEHDRKYTLATIQSIFKHPDKFKHVRYMLLDECDLWNYKNSGGMFNKFLKEFDIRPKILGFTGTPFRNVLNSKKLPNGGFQSQTVLKLINRTYPSIWSRIVYNINNNELTELKYLTPIIYEDRTIIPHIKIPTNSGRSDFDLAAFAKLLEPYEQDILDDIAERAKTRKSILVFCASLGQAERMSLALNNSGFVAGDTPTKERDVIVKDFKEGRIKTVFNYGTLTTGFDSADLDTIYLLRPTKSIRLYGQMIGRCTRLGDDKTHSLMVDYSGSYADLGKLEDIIVQKDDAGKWELYANGEPRHNVVLFNYVVDEHNRPKKGLKLGGKSI